MHVCAWMFIHVFQMWWTIGHRSRDSLKTNARYTRGRKRERESGAIERVCEWERLNLSKNKQPIENPLKCLFQISCKLIFNVSSIFFLTLVLLFYIRPFYLRHNLFTRKHPNSSQNRIKKKTVLIETVIFQMDFSVLKSTIQNQQLKINLFLFSFFIFVAQVVASMESMITASQCER